MNEYANYVHIVLMDVQGLYKHYSHLGISKFLVGVDVGFTFYGSI